MPTFNAKARSLLQKLEGCRLKAYQDTAGIWTIGVGHTGPEVHPGLVWSQEQVDEVFARDVAKFAAGVARLITQGISDNRFGALVIFAFNIGIRAFAKSTALRRVNTGQFDKVPAAIMMWTKITDPKTKQKVVSPGLLTRRRAEIALWNEAGSSGSSYEPGPIYYVSVSGSSTEQLVPIIGKIFAGAVAAFLVEKAAMAVVKRWRKW